MNQLKKEEHSQEKTVEQITSDQLINQLQNFKNTFNNQLMNLQKKFYFLVEFITNAHEVQQINVNHILEDVFLYCKPFLQNKFDDCQSLIDQTIKEIEILIQKQQDSMASQKKATLIQEIQNNNMNQQILADLYPLKCELKQIIKEDEFSFSFSFNKFNSTMISGYREQIKLWNIKDGQIQNDPLVLFGHTKVVTCLKYGNNENYFISGSDDGSIRLWKKAQKNCWFSKSLIVHQQGVQGILFNTINQQIISFGKDPQINIIQFNPYQELKITQTLNKHSSILNFICINESESILASSDNDKKIIIWEKDQNAQWSFKQILDHSNIDFFSRMVFVNNYLVCQQWTKPISQVFIEQNEQLILRSDLQINLTQQTQDDDTLFPSIYNKNKGILIQKHGKYIYFLKQQQDSKFIQVCQPIDCFSIYNYGNLTEDGENLIIWNDQTNEIRVYKLISN